MLFTLQRYEFLSKSQPSWLSISSVPDVVYLTKVRIFKQITTVAMSRYLAKKMLFTLQRYEFLSKSQLVRVVLATLMDVVYLTKVRIFKQITTH